jgi:hypothetical protein
VIPVDVRRLSRYVIPLLLFAFFAVEKASLNPSSRNERLADGVYYFQIAQHVADGDGLRTSVSLRGQGLRNMPSPAAVQPLWPLVLGYAGRVLGMDRAAHLLPEVFYFGSLLLLYLLANQLGSAFGSRDLIRFHGITVLDLGALAIAIFGGNAVFSAYTSKAYTEGLAFCLLFATLLALPTATSRRVLARAAASGLLAGLAYLTRSQFILIPLAVAAALALVRIREPRLRGAWLASLAASAGVVIPWIIFLTRSLPTFTARVLIDFSAHRENEALLPRALTVEYDGPLDRMIDFAGSFLQAFHPTPKQAYIESFGPIAYAIPLALAVAGWRLWSRRREWTVASAPGFDALLAFATLFAALSALAPVHVSHMGIGLEWLFGWRHGLPLILAILLALASLCRHRTWARIALILVVAVGTLNRTWPPDRYIRLAEMMVTKEERALLNWIDQHPRPPVVLIGMGRWLAASSRAVAHVPPCDSDAMLRKQLSALTLDYIAIHPIDRRYCRALSNVDRDELELVRSFGQPPRRITVWRPANAPAEEGTEIQDD